MILEIMKIKICGIKSAEDVAIINEFKPNFAGFIFYPKSKRFLSKQKAKELKKLIDPDIQVVGVFVDEDSRYIKELIEESVIDIVQLHGHEDQDTIDFLKSLGIPVIKAIRVKSPDSLLDIKKYDPDYFLFDIYSKDYGGTGKTFNWDLLDNYDRDIPYFLAGGLNIDNLNRALELPAFSLDISSGVETNGNKDKKKIKEIINSLRNFNGK